MSSIFLNQLVKGLELLKIQVSEEGLRRLNCYWQELQKWSKKVNLVAKGTSVEQLGEAHYLDSLVLLPLLASRNASLLDIGSGAGFPGLACGAAMPDLMVTLLEPRGKRAAFLRHVVRTCGLANVEVVEGRVEDEQLLPSTRYFSVITGRAVADIDSMVQMAERFGDTRPQLVLMKGPKWHEELKQAESRLGLSVFSLHTANEYELPFSKAQRCLLIFQCN